MKSPLLIVFFKEVIENLRDRRTLINALIISPLLGPLLFATLFTVLTNREIDKAEKSLEIPIIGGEHAPNLIGFLKQQGLKAKPAVVNPEQAVRDQETDIVLRIPSSYPEAWRKGQPAEVELIYDDSQRDSSSSISRLRNMLEAYSRQNGALRLLARGLSPAIAQPLIVAERDQSTPQSRSALLFGMMPYLFILTAFMGGMYLAIDTTAGERERQSLEPLFANPVARWKILAGKLGATSLFALMSLALSLLGFAIAGRIMPIERLGAHFDLGLHFAIVALTAMLPFVLLGAALQTLVAAFAKSYREAQTYLSMLLLVPMLPSGMLAVMPVKAELWMFAVPLLGQHLAIVRLVRGETVSLLELGVCVAVGFVVALCACLLTAAVYRSERLAISG